MFQYIFSITLHTSVYSQYNSVYYQVLLVCPQSVSRSLVAPLISIVNSDIEQPLDNLTWAALATLAEIGEEEEEEK